MDADVSLERTKVLIVEDEPDVRDVLMVVLTTHGAEARAAESADAALEALRSWQPDVIISDVGLPDTDGCELMRRIRKLPADEGGRTPAIAVTGHTLLEDRIRVLGAGFQHYVAKPIDVDELLGLVLNVLAAPP